MECDDGCCCPTEEPAPLTIFLPISVNDDCFFGSIILDMTFENTDDAIDDAVVSDAVDDDVVDDDDEDEDDDDDDDDDDDIDCD